MDRSGTFLAIDYSLHQAVAESQIDVFRYFIHLKSNCADMEINKVRIDWTVPEYFGDIFCHYFI